MNDTNSPTWRELADQLTSEQISDLEHLDALADIPGSGFTADSPRRIAEEFAVENAAQVIYADIPAPADAISPPTRWEEWDERTWARGFTSMRRRFEYPAGTPGAQPQLVTVDVSGWQLTDGTCERSIYASGDALESMTPEQAREVAAALLAAADRIDAVTGTPATTPPCANFAQGSAATRPTDVLSALRKLADEVEAEVEGAEPGVWTILRAELSGIKRAILRAETAVLNGSRRWI